MDGTRLNTDMRASMLEKVVAALNGAESDFLAAPWRLSLYGMWSSRCLRSKLSEVKEVTAI